MSATTTTADRAERAADVGAWLFCASVVMLVASFVSAYVLLRAGNASWPTPWVHSGFAAIVDPWFRLLWLVIAAGTARAAARDEPRGTSWLARHPLTLAGLAGVVFVVRTWTAGQALVADGHGPASGIAPATWFALNGAVALLVLAGVIATACIALVTIDPPVARRRARVLAGYWTLLAACFAVIAVGMYVR